MDGVLVLVPLAVIACGVIAIVLGGFHPAHIYSRRGGFGVMVVGVVLLLIAGPSMPLIGTHQLPTVTVPLNAYPSDAVTHFTSMCEGDGNGRVLCACYITSMQGHYPYAEVKDILTVNNSDAPEWDAVTKDCASVAAS